VITFSLRFFAVSFISHGVVGSYLSAYTSDGEKIVIWHTLSFAVDPNTGSPAAVFGYHAGGLDGDEYYSQADICRGNHQTGVYQETGEGPLPSAERPASMQRHCDLGGIGGLRKTSTCKGGFGKFYANGRNDGVTTDFTRPKWPTSLSLFSSNHRTLFHHFSLSLSFFFFFSS